MSEQGQGEAQATDFVVLWSSESGRAYGISVDRIGGEEQISITELQVRDRKGGD